jgi:hypothetical protein
VKHAALGFSKGKGKNRFDANTTDDDEDDDETDDQQQSSSYFHIAPDEMGLFSGNEDGAKRGLSPNSRLWGRVDQDPSLLTQTKAMKLGSAARHQLRKLVKVSRFYRFSNSAVLAFVFSILS